MNAGLSGLQQDCYRKASAIFNMYHHNLLVYRKKNTKFDSIFPGPPPPQPLIGDDLNTVLPITTASAKKSKSNLPFFITIIKVCYKTWACWVNPIKPKAMGVDSVIPNLFLHNLKSSQRPAHQHGGLPQSPPQAFSPSPPCFPIPVWCQPAFCPFTSLPLLFPPSGVSLHLSLSHQLSIYF